MTATQTQDAPVADATSPPVSGFTPPREGQIFALMSRVMSNVKGIAKTRLNKEQNYAFRSIDDAYNVVQPALVDAGVFCTPRVIAYTSKPVTSSRGNEGTQMLMEVAFEWCAPDGSSVTTVMLGQAIDYSDKAANKAMSAAYKYAMLETFCIPVSEGGDERDGDYSTPDARPPASQPPQPRPSKAAPAPTGYVPSCSACAVPMVEKKAKKDGKPFWSCPNYPKCKKTLPFGVVEKQCPDCGEPLVRRDSAKGAFLGCTGYPNCKHTERLPSATAPTASPPAAMRRTPTLAQEIGDLAKRLAGAPKNDSDIALAEHREKAAKLCCAIATTTLGRPVTSPNLILAKAPSKDAPGLWGEDAARSVRDELKARIAAAKEMAAKAAEEDGDVIPFDPSQGDEQAEPPVPEFRDTLASGMKRADVNGQIRAMLAEIDRVCGGRGGQVAFRQASAAEQCPDAQQPEDLPYLVTARLVWDRMKHLWQMAKTGQWAPEKQGTLI